jgi:hypothetical protein
MKKLIKFLMILVFAFPILTYSQYSNYYTVNVKQDIKVKGEITINEKIETIDYGALALAEAQNEKNALENKIYADNNQKRNAVEIANNPLKAYDYGEDIIWDVDAANNVAEGQRKIAKSYGFNYFYAKHKRPNSALYALYNGGWSYINESNKGVTTIISLSIPSHILTTTEILDLKKKERQAKIESWNKLWDNTEYYIKNYFDLTLGIKNTGTKDEYYLHKVEIKRANVAGSEGFILTRCKETNYEREIEDLFISMTSDGFYKTSSVKYKGDRDILDFKELESRRAYLGALNRKLISTISLYNYKINND